VGVQTVFPGAKTFQPPTAKFESAKLLRKELTPAEVSLKLSAAKDMKGKTLLLAEKQPGQPQEQPMLQERVRDIVSDYFIKIVVPVLAGALLLWFAVLSIAEYVRKQRILKREATANDPEKQKKFQQDTARLQAIEKQEQEKKR